MRLHRFRGLFACLAIVCAAVVVSPAFDALCDRSFAWHMVQHLVLMFIVPLFLLLADPFSAVLAIAGKRNTAWLVRATKGIRNVASPPVALAIVVAVLWSTHFSTLYELSLENESIHLAEHAAFFTAGIFFWLPVLAPPPVRPVSYPARLLYLLLALPQGALLAAAIASAHEPLYSHYAHILSPAPALADQSNAAAIMWIAGGLFLFVAFLATAGAWAYRERGA